jgi:hypothetical protein
VTLNQATSTGRQNFGVNSHRRLRLPDKPPNRSERADVLLFADAGKSLQETAYAMALHLGTVKAGLRLATAERLRGLSGPGEENAHR